MGQCQGQQRSVEVCMKKYLIRNNKQWKRSVDQGEPESSLKCSVHAK